MPQQLRQLLAGRVDQLGVATIEALRIAAAAEEAAQQHVTVRARGPATST